MSRTRRSLVAGLSVLTAIVGGLSMAPRALALVDVGPVDPATRFPTWYEDENSVALQPCTNVALCAPAAANENIYWQAKANVGATGNNGIDLALIGGFPAVTPTPGTEVTFARIRVRLKGLTPAANYTVTHPYGTATFAADTKGAINSTTIFGCTAAPCDFRAVIGASPIKPFLVWDPAVAPAAPAGFIGNPFVDHTVTGSPLGTNYFELAGPNAGGAGVNVFRTNLFKLQGQIAPGPFRVADAPTNLAGHAGPGAGVVSLSWSAPALDGGTPVTGYRVYGGTDAAALTAVTDLAATARSFVDSGRPDNITMHYQVTALNAVGESARSIDLAVATLSSPTAPQALSAMAGPGAGEISLTWNPPSSNGSSALTGYSIYSGPDAAHLTVLSTVDAATTNFVDRGLPEATTMFYAVTATNSIGEGPASLVASATTFARPGAVGSVMVAPGALPTQVTVSWTAPQSDGGTPLTAYRIFRTGPDGATTLVATLSPESTTYADQGVLPLFAYHYEVTAVNLVGEGAHAGACGHASPWVDALAVLFPCS